MRFFIVIFICILIAGCGSDKKNNQVFESFEFNKEIVLMNIGAIDRCTYGELIRKISNCSPKIIAINSLFIEERDRICDSTLSQSILDSQKVVLVEDYQNGILIESNIIFSEVCLQSGLNGLSINDDGVTDFYYRITDKNDKWVFSFPFFIALKYDSLRNSKLVAMSSPKDYPIKVRYSIDDFKIIDYDDFSIDCNDIKNKIVIFGRLGPDNQNMVRINVSDSSDEKVFETVLIANVVVDILSD